MTPHLILATTFLAVGTYIFGQGWERFYYESWGTLILLPIICTRLAPPPLNEWVVWFCLHGGDWVISAIPLFLFLGAAVASGFAFQRRSLPLALLASLLLGTLFVTYHLVKHLGLRVDYV